MIEKDSGFSWILVLKTLVFVKDLNHGFSSDVGFWFFFRILIHSFYGPGSSGIGFESLIDQLTIQTYNTAAAGTRGLTLNLTNSVFTVQNRRNTKVVTWFPGIFLEAT